MDFDYLIVTKILSYTEAERIDFYELERLEIMAKLYGR